MARSEGLSPHESQLPSRRLFPVGRAAIDTAQYSIVPTDRAVTTDIEINYLNRKNEEFHSVLKKFFGRYTERVDDRELKFYRNPFMDGAMFVHFAFRMHAEDQIPTFLIKGERNDVEDIFEKEMNDISRFAWEKDIDEQELEIIAQIRISQLAKPDNEDSLLGQAIIKQSETFNDTRDGDTFLVGAMFAYDAIKRRYEDNEQEKRDSETQQIRRDFEEISRGADQLEVDGWTDDPELAGFEDFAHQVWNAEKGTKHSTTDDSDRSDTSDLGVDFEAGIGEIEEFLRRQTGKD